MSLQAVANAMIEDGPDNILLVEGDDSNDESRD